jgi:thiamine pyrophosphate-dependent acetolactate synthase large subunit-like protein
MSGEMAIARGATNLLGPDLKAFAAASMLKVAGLPVFVPTSPDNARQTFVDAVAEAALGKAVALLLPTDVQTGKALDRPDDPRATMQIVKPAPQPARAASITSAVELLSRAKRPIILGGIGVHSGGARARVEALADRIGALLVTTVKAKDLFRGNPWDLGILGSSSHSAARSLIETADCVLAFGAAMNSLTMSSGIALPPVPLIHVDAQRLNINRYWQADVAVVGDAKLVAEQLIAALPERATADKPFRTEEIKRKLAGFEHTQDFQSAHTARTLDSRVLSLELSKILPENRHMVFDGGNFMANWAYVSVKDPSWFTHTQDFGSVGLGIGTALGVARARPERQTVLFIGDGGLLMSMGELETIIREDLPMVVFVMNDAAYGAEVHILRGQNLPVAKAEFADVDFAPMAEALGFETATIRTMDDLKTLAPRLAKPDGPMLIDCKINVEVIAPFITEFTHKDKD